MLWSSSIFLLFIIYVYLFFELVHWGFFLAYLAFLALLFDFSCNILIELFFLIALSTLSHDFLMLLFSFFGHYSIIVRFFCVLLVHSTCCYTISIVIGWRFLLLLISFCCYIHFFLCYSFPLVANWLFLLWSLTLVVILLFLLLPSSSHYYLNFFMLVGSFCLYLTLFLLLFISSLVVIFNFSCLDFLF